MYPVRDVDEGMVVDPIEAYSCFGVAVEGTRPFERKIDPLGL